MQEQTILLNLSKGDPEAFRAIYDRYHTSIYLIAYRCLKSDDDAKDVRANCFIKLWEHHNKIIFDKFSALYLWLHNIAYHECIDQVRKTKLHTAKNLQIQYEVVLTQEQAFELTDKEAIIIDRILNKLEAMPQKFKEIFKMRCYDDLKFTEIAQILKADISTVKKRYARAVKLIKK